MEDDPQSSGGDPLPHDQALAPATNRRAPAPEDVNADESEDATTDSQHDDADHGFDQRPGEDAAARDESGAKRPVRSLQKRIDELVRQRAAATRDRDLWRERALSISADDSASTQDASMPDASTNEPERQAGPDDSAPDLPPELAAFADRIAEARGRYADFDLVAFDPAVPVSAAMAETIARSDHGADIAYQLGRSPDLARHIAGLDPLSAARELGRIEAALSSAAPRKATGAPPPIRTLDGAESPRRDPDAMTYDQYKRWRSAR